MFKEPETAAEWQEAIDLARFYLLLDSARQYGLVVGGPLVAARRCHDLIKRGAKAGYKPAADEALTARYAPMLMASPE